MLVLMTGDEQIVDSTVAASRALLGVVARSMAPALEEVTVPQFRVLVLLDTHGPQRSGTLAEQVGVHQSTFTRMVDRLVAGGWVTRGDSPHSRREVLVSLTEAGRRLVDTVTARRREEIRRILAALPAADRRRIAEAMGRFTAAAGEPATDDLLVLGM